MDHLQLGKMKWELFHCTALHKLMLNISDPSLRGKALCKWVKALCKWNQDFMVVQLCMYSAQILFAGSGSQ